MKKKKFNLGETNMVIALTIIVMAYWCCQVCLHYFMFPGSDIYSHVFGSNLFEQATRGIAFCFFALLVSQFQYVVRMRRQAEKEAKANEWKYDSIIRGIEDGYYEVDFNGNFTFFNDNDLNYVNHFTLQQGNTAKTVEHEIVGEDGANHFIETSVSPLKDVNDKIIGYRGMTRDVTEVKRAREAHNAKVTAEISNAAKSDFLAKMSHEIRTPLNGIIGMSEIALSSNIDENQKKISETILSESNNLLNIINDILDFSKIEAGKIELEEIPFNLGSLIDDVTHNFAVVSKQKGLEFNSFLALNTPNQLIGDPGRLRQILVNLIGNALKFTHEGDIYINGELAEDLGEKIKIRFMIEDTGIGISKDQQKHIFDDFAQADASTTREYGGTGLGTTIAKRFAELMGGEIGNWRGWRRGKR